MSQNNIPKIVNPMDQMNLAQDAQAQAGPSIPTQQPTFSSRVNLNTDVLGLFEVVSVVPAGIPKNAYDQIKIYTNSTTYRFYWYDYVNGVWHYATGT